MRNKLLDENATNCRTLLRGSVVFTMMKSLKIYR